jgi:maltose alpha-D-glucosyltransferase/alpha-amylase
MSSSDPGSTPLLDDRSILSAIQDPILHELPGFLRQQRWFADKHRQIESIAISDIAFEGFGQSLLILPIVEVRFADGHTALYFVPLLVIEHQLRSASSLGMVTVAGRQLEVIDAVAEPAFHRWLLGAIREGRRFDSQRGRLNCRPEGDWSLPAAQLVGRLAGVEQSNTSIFFGDAFVAKIYRRLSPGLNPDLVVGRFLNSVGGTTVTPALVGSIEYTDDQSPITLVTVNEQLTDPVDCWSYLLAALREGDFDAAAIGSQLGDATATMHVALASAPGSSDFATVPAAERDIASWKSVYEASLDQVARQLELQLVRFDDSTRQLADAFRASLPALRLRSNGFDSLLGMPLMRVHGDYHLGQVLRLPDGEMRIVDFEGEPQRPVHERRVKTSPLKDVTGMLRSFSYAHGTLSRAADDVRRRKLNAWEAEQRRLYIDAYKICVQSSRIPLIPTQESALAEAIAAWEADKALYEVMYELSSRPDWLWIPLRSLVESV